MILTDRLEPWLNPILVRSLRQALRSRGFMGVYTVVLLVTTITAVLTSLMSNLDREGTAGHGLFIATVICWTFAAWFAQPLVAFGAVIRERNEDTWDLVDLTGIRPRSVVLGMLATALVQAAVVGAGLAPFLVLSYLLRGVDFGNLLLAILGLPLGTAVLSSFAVLVGCLGRNRASRSVLGSMLALGLAGLGFGMAVFWCNEGADEIVRIILESDSAWLGLGLFSTGCLGAIYLFSVLAATLMTHQAADRSSAGRMAGWVLWLAAFLWFLTAVWWWNVRLGRTHDLDMAFAGFAAMGIGWSILVGFFAVTEPDSVTRRQMQAVQAGGRLRRAAMAILGPGAARGRRNLLLMFTVNAMLCAFSFWFEAGSNDKNRAETVAVAIGMIAYAAFLFGPIAWAMRRWGGRWFGPAIALRGALLGFCAVWFLVGTLGLALLDGGFSTDLTNPLMALSPVFGFQALVSDQQSWTSPTRLLIVIVGALALIQLIYQSSPRPGALARIEADPAGRRGEV